MLNAEKYKEDILSDEGNELDKAFRTCEKNIGHFSTYNGLIRWLLSEYQEPPILDEVEREYLSAVCKPYEVSKIIKFNKYDDNEWQWIDIAVDNGFHGKYKHIQFPYFKSGTMYKGMKVKKAYTPQELGIKCKNNPNGEIKHD